MHLCLLHRPSLGPCHLPASCCCCGWILEPSSTCLQATEQFRFSPRSRERPLLAVWECNSGLVCSLFDPWSRRKWFDLSLWEARSISSLFLWRDYYCCWKKKLRLKVENRLKLGLWVTGVDQWFCEIVCEFSSCKVCVCWSPKVFLLCGQTVVWRGWLAAIPPHSTDFSSVCDRD